MDLTLIKERTMRPQAEPLHAAVAAAANGNPDAQAQVCGAMVWSSFSAPGAITAVFDIISAGKLQQSCPELAIDAPEAPLPDTFWDAFAATIEGPEEGYNATSITVAVAKLGGAVNPTFGVLAEAAASTHPGARGAATKAVPSMISLDELASQPDDSLARALYSMLVDNGFDAEVLDREAIGLQQLPPAMRYLNTRILQMHDIWHLTAGYATTSLHEMAISAFQLAQFGHNYSAMFLSTVCTMSHLKQPLGFTLLLQNMAEAWQHGREQPAFMDIHWEDEWHMDIASVRAKHDINAFNGSFPADLLEQLSPS